MHPLWDHSKEPGRWDKGKGPRVPCGDRSPLECLRCCPEPCSPSCRSLLRYECIIRSQHTGVNQFIPQRSSMLRSEQHRPQQRRSPSSCLQSYHPHRLRNSSSCCRTTASQLRPNFLPQAFMNFLPTSRLT